MTITFGGWHLTNTHSHTGKETAAKVKMNAIPVLILVLCAAAAGALAREPTPDEEALDRLRRYFGQLRFKLDLPAWYFTRPPTKVSNERALQEESQLVEDMPSDPWSPVPREERKRGGGGGGGQTSGTRENPCEGLPQLASGAIPVSLLSDDLKRLDENKDGAMNEAELQRFFMSVEILQLCSGLTKEVKRGQ